MLEIFVNLQKILFSSSTEDNSVITQLNSVQV